MDKVLSTVKKGVAAIKKIFSIAFYSVRQRLTSPRVICILVLAFVFVWGILSGIGDLTDTIEARINPLVFTFISNDQIYQFILFLSVVFLYSDAPFINKSQPYVIIRSKRISWALGEIIHVIIFSAVYFFILMFVSVLMLLPNATFSTDGWGIAVNTLVKTNIGDQLDIGLFPSNDVISFYSPLKAFVMCFLLNWMMASFLGLLIFSLNLIFDRVVGPIVGVVIILLDLLTNNTFGFYKFSPLSMSRLSVLDPTGTTTNPSPAYAFAFYCIGIVIFSVCIIASVKRKAIEISSES